MSESPNTIASGRPSWATKTQDFELDELVEHSRGFPAPEAFRQPDQPLVELAEVRRFDGTVFEAGAMVYAPNSGADPLSPADLRAAAATLLEAAAVMEASGPVVVKSRMGGWRGGAE